MTKNENGLLILMLHVKKSPCRTGLHISLTRNVPSVVYFDSSYTTDITTRAKSMYSFAAENSPQSFVEQHLLKHTAQDSLNSSESSVFGCNE